MDKLVNLWDETIDALRVNGKTWNDVLYVCAGDVEVINFEGVARRTNYDADYGSQRVAFDLEVVGANFWLERAEYDGAEWWEYRECRTRPTKSKIVEKLAATDIGDAWENLATIDKWEVEE